MSNTALLGSYGGQGNSSLMFRNKIINGAMEISQRGNNFTTNGYTLDRWTVFNSGGTFTVSQQTAASGAQPENGMSKFLRVQRTSPSGIFYLEQKIEDVSLYDGITVSVSFYAKANTAIVLPVRVTQEFGSGGSSSVITGTVNVNITSSWAKYTASFTLPSLSGKTIGANSYLALTFDSPATYTTLDITGVQLEAETATPFERRPYSVEEAMCMRYAERVHIRGFSVAHGFDFNDSRFPYIHAFKVRKRIDSGSITGITGASSTNNDGSATPTFTGIVGGLVSADAAAFYANYSGQRPNLEHHWLNGIVVVSAEL